ncbi:hypothetical protein E2P81_ATG06766 [Venturia nashicola]|uniref:Enoyl reductase (ER) domain-containing protein n=1 Tax=Venturia nashicola TaxID=86259 RepID=A0A4Z1PCW0_9PEZI|nr:hypothetical protein E6O75_ATG06937 [Venturia nashicola]TLD30113.1 hypothetical protein E2P81_ATG06766 [Venturia nashicola]
MKEAFVTAGPTVEIKDVPIPEPGPDQVVTKVVVSGSNPKDWKIPEWFPQAGPINQGDDISGTVHAVGSNVTEFKVGDRVAAFHEMMSPHGSYAEYALSWQHTTFHLPQNTSFEEGASIPLAAMTAALGLYQRLGLPEPWQRNSIIGKPFASEPLVIWGAGSAVGSYAIQLAARSNIHPLICIAGSSTSHVQKFIDPSKGDTIIDYRPGTDHVMSEIKNHLGTKKLRYAFDAVSDHGSYQSLSQILDVDEGRITLVLPGKEYPEIPATIKKTITSVGSVHKEEEDKEFAYLFFRYFARGLGEGWFKGQPTVVVPGGLGGIQKALGDLKEGRASAVKYVFRIEETEGVKSGL